MSFNGNSKWNRNNRGRRGRGRPNRGGFDRDNRSGPRDNFGQYQQYGNRGGGGGGSGGSQWPVWNQADQGQPAAIRVPKPVGRRLTEVEIGATKYVSDHDGFNGIIKSRYSDFQVSEINDKGEVAKLTKLKPPAPIVDSVDDDEDLLLSKYNVEILPMETWDSINKLFGTDDNCPEKVQVDVTGMSKEQRTKIHDAVKKAFGSSIVGRTVTRDDKKSCVFMKYKKGVRIDTRVKWTWPGEFVHFVVYKENCDTMEAAQQIADRLRMKTPLLGYAGTKDRRAKTTQWMSLRRVDPKKIANALRGLRGIYGGNYTFHDHSLRLGLLKGNRFRIVLRNVTAENELISKACTLLHENGFINYYGLQRFGTRVNTPTYSIGKHLLKGDFQEAIYCILDDRNPSNPLVTAFQLYRNVGPAVAAPWLPARASGPEPALLRSLAQRPNDLAGALGKIPRNTRLLYMHSYQSFVWNRVVSERIARFGLRPAVGDLVPLTKQQIQDLEESEEQELEELVVEKIEQDGSDAELKLNTEEGEKTQKDRAKDKEEEYKLIPVKILTQADLDSGTYTIFDIVMPLPGYRVEYPPNMKSYYEELLAEDDLTLELQTKHKAYSMSGAYRYVAIRPIEFSHSIVTYNDPHADLIASDLDQMQGKKITGCVEGGKYKALILTMSLPSSCYATMALRELLRVDTASDQQALQNNYHKRKLSETEEPNSKVRVKENDNGDAEAIPQEGDKNVTTGEDGDDNVEAQGDDEDKDVSAENKDNDDVIENNSNEAEMDG